MKLAILILLAVACFLLACHQANDTSPHQVLQQMSATETPVSETVLSLASVTSVQFAKIITVERPEDAQATVIRFAPLSLKKRLPARAEVLLIPLSGALAAIRTKVLKINPIENLCSDALPKLYETELRPVNEKSWLSSSSPFEVCVIYPAIASARALKFEALQAAELPLKVNLANITAALDMNNDQQPEVLLVEYCCDNPQADRKYCDLTCSAVYVRESNGQWRIVETQTPC